MPCYTEPPTQEEEERWCIEAYKKGEWERFYRLTSKRMLAQWLCDTMRGNPPHAHCRKWWELHRKYADKEKEGTRAPR